MPRSPLRGFNRHSVDQLVEEGVHMVYDHSLIKKDEYLGLWIFQYNLVSINPTARINYGKLVEDETIIHEFLHGYEDLILNPPRDFRESQIEYWARFHRLRDSGLAAYIRKPFKDFGF